MSEGLLTNEGVTSRTDRLCGGSDALDATVACNAAAALRHLSVHPPSVRRIAAAGGVPGGTMAGPMMLWTATGSAMVLTPVTQTMEMNMAWDAATATLEAGLLGSVAEIPANYTSETMLFLGNRTRESCQPRACGLNSAVAGWGVALRRYKGKDTGFPAGGFDADPTLAYLGY